MSYRLDYDEPINLIVKRLKQEHKEIDRKLERVSKISMAHDGNLKVALSLLAAAKTEILRHAVEEEARLARVIMGNHGFTKNQKEVTLVSENSSRASPHKGVFRR